MTNEELRKEYDSIRSKAEGFCAELRRQIERLLSQHNIVTGVPIESRVKTWESVSSKIERNALKLDSVCQLSDLIGLRLVFLFKRDMQIVCDVLSQEVAIVNKEDAGLRLDASQFGYQSLHYIVAVPKEWLTVPSFKECECFQAEIQIRTLAQHIWAAASHTLQYKHEAGVPAPVRRSISRVSALLETVDLEFERVLIEREQYQTAAAVGQADEALNVDLLKAILDRELPKANKREDEPYAEILEELLAAQVGTSSKLIALIEKHGRKAVEKDAAIVHEFTKDPKRKSVQLLGEFEDSYNAGDRDVPKQGAFFTHAGLVRQMLNFELGFDGYEQVLMKARLASRKTGI